MDSLSNFFRVIKILGGLFVLFVIFVVVRGGILTQIHESEKNERNRAYYQSFNKYFKGIVVKIKRREPKKEGKLRTACYRLQLIESTSRYYRPARKNSQYFCVIDFPYAEVIAKDFGDVQIGDTCYFNGTTDCLWTKIANKKWRGQRPEIGQYAFLNKPYTTIPQYDSLQLVWRKSYYPKKENTRVSQMNYYWRLNCNKKMYNKDEVSYDHFFYNYSKWKSDVEPFISARKNQAHFYMIQVADYIIPLNLDSLMERFNGESIIWIKDKKRNRYFLNMQLLRLSEAKKYLEIIKKRFNLTDDDKLEIRKVKSRVSVNWFDTDLDEIAINLEPDVQVIPAPISFIDYSWLIIILFTFINVLMNRIMLDKDLKEDKIFAKGFKLSDNVFI